MSKLAYEQFQRADNMTDAMAALAVLANLDCPERAAARSTRSTTSGRTSRWWWTSGSRCRRARACRARSRGCKQLLSHPAFDLKVPNKVYALIRTFAANHVRFHAADGAGYAFLADQVIALNALNPQVAARMARGSTAGGSSTPAGRRKRRRRSSASASTERLSSDVGEIVGKALA